MNKVVKCKNVKCAQYFMRTEKNTKCPFCYTECGEVEKETKNPSAMPAHAGQAEKKVSAKTKKESFKIWRKN